MYAVSLHQPWATFIALGIKWHETRSWQTSYRGPLLIHATAGFPAYARAACLQQPLRGILEEHNIDPARVDRDLPRGAIVAATNLNRIWPTHKIRDGVSDHERAVGDWSDDRFAWQLANHVALLEPVPARGAQGLWPVSDELWGLVSAQLCAECAGRGEVYGHTWSCKNDNCALAGGMDDCRGQVMTCPSCGPIRKMKEIMERREK